MLQQQVDPDLALALSVRNSEEEIGFLLLQAGRDKRAVDALSPLEVQTCSDLFGDQPQELAQVLGRFEQPESGSVGELANGRWLGIGHLVGRLLEPLCRSRAENASAGHKPGCR